MPEAVAAIQQEGAFRAESCGAAIGMLRTMQADTDTPGGPYPSREFPNPSENAMNCRNKMSRWAEPLARPSVPV